MHPIEEESSEISQPQFPQRMSSIDRGLHTGAENSDDGVVQDEEFRQKRGSSSVDLPVQKSLISKQKITNDIDESTKKNTSREVKQVKKLKKSQTLKDESPTRRNEEKSQKKSPRKPPPAYKPPTGNQDSG